MCVFTLYLTAITLDKITSSPIPSPSKVSGELGEITDGVGSIAKILNDYGVLIGILAVVLVMFIVLIAYLIYNGKKTTDAIIHAKEDQNEIISKVVADLLGKIGNGEVQQLQSLINKQESQAAAPVQAEVKKDIVARYMDTNMIFKDASRIALNKLKCERVAVYVFHNGNKSNHGLPFFKTSCISEQTMRGSGTVRGKAHIELPLHIFSDIVENIYKEGEYVASSVKNQCVVDQGLESFVQFSQIKSLFILGISDKDGMLGGFVISEFGDEKDFTDKEVYTSTKESLSIMIDNIKSVVLDYQSIYGAH